MENYNDVNSIRAAIADAGASWNAEPNFLATLPDEERKKYLGYTPGPQEPPLEEQERIAAQNLVEFQARAQSGGFGAPASIDWRNKDGQNYVTPVKNQGGCGSCVAFGTTASVESRIKIERGAAYPIDLSEAHLFYCIARTQGRTCGNGWWPDKALDGYKEIGVPDEACYPYTAGDQNCTGRCADWANRVIKISAYTKPNDVAAMKEWIATNGPIEACFTVYSDFYNYSSGVYKKVSGTVQGGHCVCVVGYDDAQQCWICKNSWGTGWGEGGFFRIGYGQVGIDSEMMGPNSILGSYWIRGKKVTGLWAHASERNAYVHLSDTGWKKISNQNDDGFINALNQLATAKAVNANVDVEIDNNMIVSLYVF